MSDPIQPPSTGPGDAQRSQSQSESRKPEATAAGPTAAPSQGHSGTSTDVNAANIAATISPVDSQPSRQGARHGAGTAEAAPPNSERSELDAVLSANRFKKLNFETVWQVELDTIRAKREHLGISSVEAVGEGQTPAGGFQAFDTIGLALSGGGIRSAAFNLGMLQAFADQRLLGNLDYLSTVSGGGYIGSWLSCWIYRDGHVSNVEKLLSINRSDNAMATRQFPLDRRLEIDEPIMEITNPACVFAKEPEPIVHLRANSNYLALRPGVLTPDSWALIAIYLRNILLNLIVVLPVLLAVILLTMGLTSWYDRREQNGSGLPILVCLILMYIVVSGINKALQNVRNEVDDRGREVYGIDLWDRYFGWLVVFTVAAAYALSLDLVCHQSWFIYLGTWGQGIDAGQGTDTWQGLGGIALLSATLGGLHMLLNWQSIWRLMRGDKDPRLLLWPVSGLVAGMMLGVLLCGSTIALRQLNGFKPDDLPIDGNELQALLAVPMLLTSFFISEVLQVGVLGKLESPEVREKWSAFQARCFMGGMIWFALVLHVYFVANIIPLSQPWVAEEVTTAAVVTWLASAAGTLFLAQNSRTSGQGVNGNNRRWIDVLIMAGPPMFLSGIVACISALVLMVFHDSGIKPVDAIAHWRLSVWLWGAAMLCAGMLIGRFVDVNVFSLQEVYAARLIRCFLGASRRDDRPPRGAPFRTHARLRRADPITAMAPRDDIALALLKTSPTLENRPYSGPLHLINTAVNLTRDIDLQRQERKADSFVLSPVACGNPSLGYRPTAACQNIHPGYAGGLNLGIAASLSGAAVSPNMGYYSSPAVTALLTLFNVRLGAWLGNPLSTQWTQAGPRLGWLHLLKEMMGLTDSTSDYVYISDGGHFDNLGVYELLRRRVKYIFVSDAGADPSGSCNELGMIIRKAFVDFGIKIDIDISQLQIDATTGTSRASHAIGTIQYPPVTLPDDRSLPEFTGTLIYIKMTRTGREPTDIKTYHGKHPEFPHQSTAYQFYSESQFESYRHLGHFIGSNLLSGDQRSYKSGHPRLVPGEYRTPEQMKTFIEYLEAINSISIPRDWTEQSVKLDQRLAALFGQLETRRGLQKLQAEVAKITEILEVSDKIYHLPKAERDPAIAKRVELRQALVALQALPRTDWEKGRENAWMMEAITLIDTVINALDAQTYHPVWRSEWARVLRQWMCTSTFQILWPKIKDAFVPQRDRFIEALLADDTWVGVILPKPPET